MDILYQLAIIIQKNQEREAQAVQGYTEQLAIIQQAKELNTDADIMSFLDKLEDDTKEKISDELNHEKGLLAEYVELTGIEIKED